jgi:predicted glycoside hydrolase/deacetylase ChbG (UPF0249 family)
MRKLRETALIVTADDYGYAPAYDRGILEAARTRAVDAVSAMVLREGCEPEPLLSTGVEIGLHLELPGWSGVPVARAGPEERRAAVAACREQLERFEELFGRPAAYLDGHHHCHAAPGLAAALGRVAREHGLPVRSIDARHRRLLRCQGVATQDRLVGRSDESEPAIPAELEPLVRHRRGAPSGVTEWMVHPGYADPAAGSGYDAGREADLALVLELGRREELLAIRATHAATLP